MTTGLSHSRKCRESQTTNPWHFDTAKTLSVKRIIIYLRTTGVGGAFLDEKVGRGFLDRKVPVWIPLNPIKVSLCKIKKVHTDH